MMGQQPVPAQPTAPAQDVQDLSLPTLKVSTKLRVLDVTVIDKKGNPVTSGLGKDDFTIVDDRIKKEIFSFDGPSGAPGVTTLPTSVVLVIDHLNTPFEDEYWQQTQLEKYLLDQGDKLNQDTELLLFTETGLQVVEGFTRDRKDLLDAVKSIHSLIPYRLTANWNMENLSLAMGALEEVALQTKQREGRKNIIWVGSGGAGVASRGMIGEAKLRRYVRRTSNLMIEARVTLFMVFPALKVVGKQESRGGAGGQDVTASSTDPFFNGGSSIVTPAATDPFFGGVNMGVFAKATGGKVYLNSNDIVSEVHDSIALGTKYYTLSYKPNDIGSDGSFKRIQVKMKNSSLTALSKGGYYVTSRDDDPNAGENEVRFEVRKAAISSVPFSDLSVGVKGVNYYKPEQTSTFEIALKPGEIKMEQGADGIWKGEIVIAAVSTNGDHDILASASKAMAVTASNAAMAHAKVPVLKVTINLRVPRRTHTLRFVVRDMSTGRMGAFDMAKNIADTTPVATTPMPQPQGRGAAAQPAPSKPGL